MLFGEEHYSFLFLQCTIFLLIYQTHILNRSEVLVIQFEGTILHLEHQFYHIVLSSISLDNLCSLFFSELFDKWGMCCLFNTGREWYSSQGGCTSLTKPALSSQPMTLCFTVHGGCGHTFSKTQTFSALWACWLVCCVQRGQQFHFFFLFEDVWHFWPCFVGETF